MKSNFVGHVIVKNLEGQRFSSLIVLNSTTSKRNRTRWLCQCDCGKTTIATGASLRTGHKKSCGCRYQLSLMPKNETVLCRSLWGTYSSLAKKRGYSFELSFEKFSELTKRNCFYCGVEPRQVLKPRRENQVEYVYNGIDRRDNSIGYTEVNAVACCGTCNSMKSCYLESSFLDHISRISQYQNSKKQVEISCSVSQETSNN